MRRRPRQQIAGGVVGQEGPVLLPGTGAAERSETPFDERDLEPFGSLGRGGSPERHPADSEARKAHLCERSSKGYPDGLGIVPHSKLQGKSADRFCNTCLRTNGRVAVRATAAGAVSTVAAPVTLAQAGAPACANHGCSALASSRLAIATVRASFRDSSFATAVSRAVRSGSFSTLVSPLLQIVDLLVHLRRVLTQRLEGFGGVRLCRTPNSSARDTRGTSAAAAALVSGIDRWSSRSGRVFMKVGETMSTSAACNCLTDFAVEQRLRGHERLDVLQESGDPVTDRKVAQFEDADERLSESRTFSGPQQ